jgi:hypothetical protein
VFDVSEALALLRNKREALPLIHPDRFTKKLVERFLEHNKASPAVPQPLADNLTGDAGTVLAHRSTQIFKGSAAATPDPSNLVADGVGTVAAGASLPGEIYK